MTAVEVIIARNGILGPLHLAIPIGAERWATACSRRLTGARVTVWTEATGGDVWGEVRTCPDCLQLGARADSTTELAILAGWIRPPAVGASPSRQSRAGQARLAPQGKTGGGSAQSRAGGRILHRRP